MKRPKQSRIVFFVTAGAALFVSLAALIGVIHLRRSREGLPYQYSFLSGKKDDWEAFGGDWQVLNGTIENDSDERGAKLLAGSKFWTDYSVEADVKLLSPEGDAGLMIRSGDEENGVDAYRGYYAGLRGRENYLTTDNRLVLGQSDYSWSELKNFSVPGGVKPLHWYHLKLLVEGCNLAASATLAAGTSHPIAITTFIPNCIRSGRIGLRSYAGGGAWRNVEVKPAKHNDFLAMVQEASVSASTPIAESTDGPGEPPVASHVPAAKVEPIGSLRFISNASSPTATVRGVVIATSPALYLQDSSGGIALPEVRQPDLRIGDEVQATGIVEAHEFSSELRSARVDLLWPTAPIPPVSVTASQAATGAFDATFIQVTGLLRGKSREPGNTVALNLETRHQAFRALISGERAAQLFTKLTPGSQIALRGVCVLDARYTHNLTPFALLLRSPGDLDILAGPPWWSAGHLVALIVVFLLLALLAQWIHNRVQRGKLQAVLGERARLAHEMHDTLAQSFAGIGFQLQALRNELPSPPGKLRQHLELACDLVRHSHTEARRNIATLRPEHLQTLGLLRSLERSATRMVGAGDIRITASSTGEPLSLPLLLSDTFFRIGQEAIANAVRHSRATCIGISLDYRKNMVRLEVQDNGLGFADDGKLTGFGLRGMRERACMISARFEVQSSPGKGATVRVTADLPPRLTLSTLPQYLTGSIRRLRSNEHANRHSNPHPYRG